ncbi:cytochrome c oxidase assembly protein COX18, mitochondrial [Galendromus occidentalis]|uniref:Cytochrome c oxidase assembly protein COX18, mitochondrial n=1 Tax=Galendromus occidentalis TaxID=34638 RepID=A0AAJ6QN26_9ACAR|nr:cytochrome c oxidase assembly protein COX18, mitochondrial [Galendromus occidentalis]
MLARTVSASARRALRPQLGFRTDFRSSVVLPMAQKRNASQSAPSWLIDVFESPPVVFAEQTLTKIHELSGLPWWASIVISTIGIRVFVTFPLAIYSEANLAKLASLEPEAREINQILKEDTVLAKHKFNLTEQQATKLYRINLKKQMGLLIERNNCHPAKSFFLSLFQIPVWVSLSFALRDMAFAGKYGVYEYMSMSTEGIFWAKNLIHPDPFLILPVMTAVMNLTNTELYQLKSNLPRSKFLKIFHNFSRVASVIVIPVGLVMPSAACLYWFCSASTATGQQLILLSPRFRRLVRIPPSPKEDPTPYSTIWSNFQSRILRRGK